jgi:hypothetical protein
MKNRECPIEVMPDYRENLRAEHAGDKYLSDQFLELAGVESNDESMDALLDLGERDMRPIEEVMTKLKTDVEAELAALKANPKLYFAERSKRVIFDSEIRHKTLGVVFLLTVLAENQIGITDFTGENMKTYAAAMPIVDNILNYLYEVNSAYGQIDVYNENDSEATRKKRGALFIGNRGYEILSSTVPGLITSISAMLNAINQKQLSWDAAHEAR